MRPDVQVVIMLDASDPSGEAQIWQLLQAAEMFVPSVPDVTCGNTATATQMGQETIPVSPQLDGEEASSYSSPSLPMPRDIPAPIFLLRVMSACYLAAP
jgi:hypothetical protein